MVGRLEVEPGVHVHVQDLGAGAPVLFIAGLGLSHEVWDAEVRDVVEAGMRAVCVDLRGTGGSDKPVGDYSLARLAADVVVVLEALDLTDVTLVGWSLGGKLALRLATLVPERLARVAIIGSNAVRAGASEEYPFGPPAEEVLAGMVGAERRNRFKFRSRVLAGNFASEPEPAVFNFLLALFLAMPSWSALATFEAYALADQVALVPQVTLPVLQLLGDTDHTAPVAGAEWLHERLADSELVVLEDCGHFPMYEKPELFRETLLRFARGDRPATV